MTLFRTALRPSVFKTNLIYYGKKNKQGYSQKPQQIIKRQFHTNPPTPPNTPILLVLSLITGYYIYQNTPRDPPPGCLF
jgi:hypothetical protein